MTHRHGHTTQGQTRKTLYFKTTFAKLLSGLVNADIGSLAVVTGGLQGTGRLVLQDTIVQLFGQPVDEHLGRVFSFDKELWKEARKTYTSVLKGCLKKISHRFPGIAIADSDRSRSILQCKIAVTVERLFGSPPLLVLDEPGWCLSRDVARAFLEEIVSAAHERGIAVAIISHQPAWWEGLVADEIKLQLQASGVISVEHASKYRAELK